MPRLGADGLVKLKNNEADCSLVRNKPLRRLNLVDILYCRNDEGLPVILLLSQTSRNLRMATK